MGWGGMAAVAGYLIGKTIFSNSFFINKNYLRKNCLTEFTFKKSQNTEFSRVQKFGLQIIIEDNWEKTLL